MARAKAKTSKVSIRGFFRGQLVESGTGRIMGDTGWKENTLTNGGLTAIAQLVAGSAGSYVVGYMGVGTQTAAMNMSQTALVGSTAAFKALNLSTSGTCTLTCTAVFSSSDLAGSCNIGAVGLFKTNSDGSMLAGQVFGTSSWNTNQDFSLTYQLRFSTA